jgi:Protein of unknown function (DUF2796)
MKSLVFVFIIISCTVQVYAHGAHVHGVGVMTIATDTPQSASIDFIIPTDSIFGFEHDAKTAIDKKTRDNALDKIKTNIQSLVMFDSKLGCKAKLSSLVIEPEKEDADDDHDDKDVHGQHQNLKLNFALNCTHDLTGSSFRVGIMRLFPKIKMVKVQLLTETKQTAMEVKSDKDTISF